jgi:PAS domain S-box-containing protein
LSEKQNGKHEKDGVCLLDEQKIVFRVDEEFCIETFEKYRSLVFALGQVVYEHRIDDDIIIWSGEFEKVLGYDEKEMDNSIESWLGRVHPEDLPAVKAEFDKATQEKGLYDLEYRFRHRDGRYLWMHDRGKMMVDHHNKPFKLIGIFRDISEKKKAEKSLKEAKKQIEKTFEALDQAVFIVDPKDRTIIQCNPAVEKIFGYGIDEVLGRNTEFLHVDRTMYEKFGNDLFRSLNQSGIYHAEFQMKRKDGSVFFTEITVTQILDDNGNRLAVVSVVRDITKRKQTETELIQANKELEALKDRLHAENVYLQEEISLNHNFENIIGKSEPIQKVLKQVEQVASTDSTVLILGETGTGKELIARAIHSASRRNYKPLIKVDCAAIPPSLIESEFFGHEKGAFTGATRRREGRFALADGGTIFLDEIGELPKDIQAKLLRVLQEGEYEPVGSSNTRKLDIRVIAATNRDLNKAVKEGAFRVDLYYRLNVFPLKVPPLRERVDDIPLLALFFTKRFAQKMGRSFQALTQGCVQKLMTYTWPGNVREIQNVIERAMITSQGNTLDLEHLLAGNFNNTVSQQPVRTVERDQGIRTHKQMIQLERENLIAALKATHWQVAGTSGAARLLGIPASTLSSRMKVLNIKRPQ